MSYQQSVFSFHYGEYLRKHTLVISNVKTFHGLEKMYQLLSVLENNILSDFRASAHVCVCVDTSHTVRVKVVYSYNADKTYVVLNLIMLQMFNFKSYEILKCIITKSVIVCRCINFV